MIKKLLLVYNFSVESTNFAVIWTWHYTQKQQSWDVVFIVKTINRRMPNISDWFYVDYAYCDKSGRLVLQTTTASHVHLAHFHHLN